METLEHWLSIKGTLTKQEVNITKFYQERLIENLDVWNEYDLSMGFIGPILNLINFTVPYKLNLFSQRSISATIGNYELIGKVDGVLASGFQEPEISYFSFHEYKKDVNSSGDPIGQNLAAMLIGQQQNQEDEVIYGCYVVGRLWYFMVLKGKEYAISKDYSTTDEEIFDIIKILKALRTMLFKKLEVV
ncbi:MAG: hypothetical protein AAGJ18_21630 [Bacteroidota bacterium]